ncbi:MAG: RsmD family RNA methyltransferase [Opitutales bacterium]|nr:RsmD family RNA methyltransferase [Opitutales bacterium]
MRITGGKARGINLILPGKGEIRPATDYIREAVFSSLGNLPEDARVLDVFAGTGAYALEAISRGAKSACLVDKNAAATAAQKKNIAQILKALGTAGTTNLPKIECRTLDLFKAAQHALPVCDLIFCDPPWALWQKTETAKLVEFLTTLIDPATDWARIILEAPAGFDVPVPNNWQIVKIIGKKGKDQPQASVLAKI